MSKHNYKPVIMSGGDLLSQGSFGCVFHPSLSCSKQSNKSKKRTYVTKIQENSWVSINEENQSKKIRQIENYKNYFTPIETSCDGEYLKQSEIENELNKSESCDILNLNKSSLRVQYTPYMSLTKIIDFFKSDEKAMNKHKINQKLYKIIFFYKHLLDAVEKLNEQNISHHDLHQENIVVDSVRQLPIIIDFGYSHDISIFDVNKTIGITIQQHEPILHILYNFNLPKIWQIHYCLEILILNILVKSQLNMNYDMLKTFDDLEKVMIAYIKDKFKRFSSTFVKVWTDLTKNQLRYYKSLTINEMYKQLITYKHTWNTVAISLLFITICDVSFAEIPKNKTLKEFLKLLLINVHPNPKKRDKVSEIKRKLHKIFKI